MTRIETELFIAKHLMKNEGLSAKDALRVAAEKISKHPTAERIGTLRKIFLRRLLAERTPKKT